MASRAGSATTAASDDWRARMRQQLDDYKQGRVPSLPRSYGSPRRSASPTRNLWTPAGSPSPWRGGQRSASPPNAASVRAPSTAHSPRPHYDYFTRDDPYASGAGASPRSFPRIRSVAPMEVLARQPQQGSPEVVAAGKDPEELLSALKVRTALGVIGAPVGASPLRGRSQSPAMRGLSSPRGAVVDGDPYIEIGVLREQLGEEQERREHLEEKLVFQSHEDADFFYDPVDEAPDLLSPTGVHATLTHTSMSMSMSPLRGVSVPAASPPRATSGSPYRSSHTPFNPADPAAHFPPGSKVAIPSLQKYGVVQSFNPADPDTGEVMALVELDGGLGQDDIGSTEEKGKKYVVYIDAAKLAKTKPKFERTSCNAIPVGARVSLPRLGEQKGVVTQHRDDPASIHGYVLHVEIDKSAMEGGAPATVIVPPEHVTVMHPGSTLAAVKDIPPAPDAAEGRSTAPANPFEKFPLGARVQIVGLVNQRHLNDRAGYVEKHYLHETHRHVLYIRLEGADPKDPKSDEQLIPMQARHLKLFPKPETPQDKTGDAGATDNGDAKRAAADAPSADKPADTPSAPKKPAVPYPRIGERVAPVGRKYIVAKPGASLHGKIVVVKQHHQPPLPPHASAKHTLVYEVEVMAGPTSSGAVQGAPEKGKVDGSQLVPLFEIDERVRVKDLNSQAHLNGVEGNIQRMVQDPTRGVQYQVRLDASTVKGASASPTPSRAQSPPLKAPVPVPIPPPPTGGEGTKADAGNDKPDAPTESPPFSEAIPAHLVPLHAVGDTVALAFLTSATTLNGKKAVVKERKSGGKTEMYNIIVDGDSKLMQISAYNCLPVHAAGTKVVLAHLTSNLTMNGKQGKIKKEVVDKTKGLRYHVELEDGGKTVELAHHNTARVLAEGAKVVVRNLPDNAKYDGYVATVDVAFEDPKDGMAYGVQLQARPVAKPTLSASTDKPKTDTEPKVDKPKADTSSDGPSFQAGASNLFPIHSAGASVALAHLKSAAAFNGKKATVKERGIASDKTVEYEVDIDGEKTSIGACNVLPVHAVGTKIVLVGLTSNLTMNGKEGKIKKEVVDKTKGLRYHVELVDTGKTVELAHHNTAKVLTEGTRVAVKDLPGGSRYDGRMAVVTTAFADPAGGMAYGVQISGSSSRPSTPPPKAAASSSSPAPSRSAAPTAQVPAPTAGGGGKVPDAVQLAPEKLERVLPRPIGPAFDGTEASTAAGVAKPPDPTRGAKRLPLGVPVVVHGLANKPEYNGRTAVVENETTHATHGLVYDVRFDKASAARGVPVDNVSGMRIQVMAKNLVRTYRPGERVILRRMGGTPTDTARKHYEHKPATLLRHTFVDGVLTFFLQGCGDDDYAAPIEAKPEGVDAYVAPPYEVDSTVRLLGNIKDRADLERQTGRITGYIFDPVQGVQYRVKLVKANGQTGETLELSPDNFCHTPPPKHAYAVDDKVVVWNMQHQAQLNGRTARVVKRAYDDMNGLMYDVQMLEGADRMKEFPLREAQLERYRPPEERYKEGAEVMVFQHDIKPQLANKVAKILKHRVDAQGGLSLECAIDGQPAPENLHPSNVREILRPGGKGIVRNMVTASAYNNKTVRIVSKRTDRIGLVYEVSVEGTGSTLVPGVNLEKYYEGAAATRGAPELRVLMLPDPDGEEVSIVEGTRVQLKDLKKDAAFNGDHATVVKIETTSEGKIYKVRPDRDSAKELPLLRERLVPLKKVEQLLPPGGVDKLPVDQRYLPGMTVTLNGFRGRVHLNGKRGTVRKVQKDPQQGWFVHCEVPGEKTLCPVLPEQATIDSGAPPPVKKADTGPAGGGLPDKPAVGSRVELQKLTNRAHLNGKRGVITKIKQDDKYGPAYNVMQDGETKDIQVGAHNIKLLDPAAVPPPPPPLTKYRAGAAVTLCHLEGARQFFLDGRQGVVKTAKADPKVGVAVTVDLEEDGGQHTVAWQHVRIDGQPAPPKPVLSSGLSLQPTHRLQVGQRVTLVDMKKDADEKRRALDGRVGSVRKIELPGPGEKRPADVVVELDQDTGVVSMRAADGAAGAAAAQVVTVPDVHVSAEVRLAPRLAAYKTSGRYRAGQAVVVVGVPTALNGCRGTVHRAAGDLVWIDFGEPRGVHPFRAMNVRNEFSVEMRDPDVNKDFVFALASDDKTVIVECPSTSTLTEVKSARVLQDGRLQLNEGTPTMFTVTLPKRGSKYIVYRLGRLFALHSVPSNVPLPNAALYPRNTTVRAHGLINHPQLNDAQGFVVGTREQGDMLVAVQVDFGGSHGRMFLRPENVTPVSVP